MTIDLREPLLEAARKLKAMREELDEIEHRAHEPIAIVAAACRLPGGIDTPEQFWQVLDGGIDAIEPFPPSRYSQDEFLDPDPDAPGKTYCAEGGFVRDADRFDAAFFGIAPREAEAMDPAQRLALECAWETLERAGIRPGDLAQSQTGVYLGTFHSDYEPWGGSRGMEGMDGYAFTGRDGSVLSGRVAYTLGLNGPAVTINTACSSSLVALHLACMSLRSGECNLAFAGGSQVMCTPGCFVEFSRLGGLARDGRCKSFSDDADGVGWGEGCTVLLLERLSDARRAGHPVLALVRGTAINQDGRSQGLTAPNGPAQEKVIGRALAASGLRSGDIDVVEAHGTGTALGDPIEAGALAAVFGPGRPAERPLYLASCKSNIGHTQAASGTASVLKLVLALAHEKMPRTLHVTTPTRRIAWDGSGLAVLREARSWPRGERVRRAGVNSFGISGTNAHAIIEEAPPAEIAATADAPSVLPVPIVLSGADEPALRAQAERLADHLERESGVRALDLAYSLATTRTHHPARLALTVRPDRSASSIGTALREHAAGGSSPEIYSRVVGRRPGKLVMLFSGQGSQRPGMGKALYASHRAFRDALDQILVEIDPLLARPLREVMFAAPDSEGAKLLDQTEFTQPALFALEVALYRQWERWGVVPDFLLGHSIGELAAAHVAGVLTLRDACVLVSARGRLMQRARTGGAMYSISAPDAEVAAQLVGLEDRLAIAAVNGPEQTVISGDAATAAAIAAHMKEMGRRVHPLRVSHAFHSPHMDGILDELRAVAQTLTFHAPRIPLLTNLNGAIATAERIANAEYWVRQVRGAVRFRDAVRTAEQAGAERYLECGPHGVLSAMAAACVSSPSASFASSLHDGRDEADAVADAVARVHVAGANLRWDEIFADRDARRIAVPTYAFQRTRYWLDGADRDDVDVEGAGLGRVAHPLLGAALDLPSGGHVFTARVSTAQTRWLGEHRVFEHPVVPGMALLELALTAGRLVGAPRVGDLLFEAPLVLGPQPVQLQLAIDAADPEGRRELRIHARSLAAPDAPWTRHAIGTVLPAAGDASSERTAAPVPSSVVDLGDLYPRLAAEGLDYGPAFQGLRELRRDGNTLHARVALSPDLSAHGFTLHPALLDASLHAVLASAPGADLRIPFEIEHVRVIQASETRELRVEITLGHAERGQLPDDARLAIFDEQGGLLAEVGRIAFRRVSREKVATADAPALHRVAWVSRPAVASLPRGAACALVGAGPLANQIAGSLRTAGVHVARLDDAHDLAERLRRQERVVSTIVRVIDPALHRPDAASALAATTELLGELQTLVASDSLADHRYVLIAPQGPLWGLARSIRGEHPERQWTLIDTDGAERSHHALTAALFTDDEPELTLRDGEWLVPSLAPVDASSENARSLPLEGTALVTGGTSGLGAAVARHLAARHGVRHLVLASRRGGDTPEAAALRDELAALGCTVTVAACDVADRAAIERLLAAIPDAHPLAAVFHCAAVLDDGASETLSPDRVARVFGAKVAGAWHLHELTQRRDLAAFVMFSSIAGVIGNPGQSTYAAANAYLDALCASRRANGLPGISLAWGVWGEIGMAARLSQRHQDRLRESGLVPMAPAAALALLDDALSRREHVFVPLHLDHATLRRLDGSRLARLLRPTRMVATAAPTARLAAAPVAASSLHTRVSAAAPAERTRLLLDLVRTEVAAVLKLPDPSALVEDRRLDELGMDSLMAVDIRRRLENRLATRLPATVVFDHPSCRLLVDHLAATWSGS